MINNGVNEEIKFVNKVEKYINACKNTKSHCLNLSKRSLINKIQTILEFHYEGYKRANPYSKNRLKSNLCMIELFTQVRAIKYNKGNLLKKKFEFSYIGFVPRAKELLTEEYNKIISIIKEK